MATSASPFLSGFAERRNHRRRMKRGGDVLVAVPKLFQVDGDIAAPFCTEFPLATFAAVPQDGSHPHGT